MKSIINRDWICENDTKNIEFWIKEETPSIELKDFFELDANVYEYEEFLKEEYYANKITMGSYYQEV